MLLWQFPFCALWHIYLTYHNVKRRLHHKVTSKLPEMLTYLISQLEEIQTGTKCKCSVFGKAAKYLKLIQLVVQTEIPTKLSDQHITIFFSSLNKCTKVYLVKRIFFFNTRIPSFFFHKRIKCSIWLPYYTAVCNLGKENAKIRIKVVHFKNFQRIFQRYFYHFSLSVK